MYKILDYISRGNPDYSRVFILLVIGCWRQQVILLKYLFFGAVIDKFPKIAYTCIAFAED